MWQRTVDMYVSDSFIYKTTEEKLNLPCCINRFTSLCKNLFNLLEFLAEAFWCHVHHFQCLTVPVDWYRKASAKNSSKLNKFLHSEVNLLRQQIIVQDQDGQNNNIYLPEFEPGSSAVPVKWVVCNVVMFILM